LKPARIGKVIFHIGSFGKQAWPYYRRLPMRRDQVRFAYSDGIEVSGNFLPKGGLQLHASDFAKTSFLKDVIRRGMRLPAK